MKRALLLAGALLGAGCLSPGFGDHRDGAAVVVGELRRFSGEAAAGARIVALDDAGNPRSTAFAQGDGTFSLDVPNAGHVAFVADDGAGAAALGTWLVQPGGENRAGRIWLLPVSEVPDVANTRGLGFEERVANLPPTTHPFVDPVLAGGGVVVARDQVVSVDLATGAAVPISEQSAWTLGVSDLSTGLPQAISGCWATTWTTAPILGQPNHVIFFDVENRRQLIDLDVNSNRELLAARCDADALRAFVVDHGGPDVITLYQVAHGSTQVVQRTLWTLPFSPDGLLVSSGAALLITQDFSSGPAVRAAARWRFDAPAPDPLVRVTSYPKVLSSDGLSFIGARDQTFEVDLVELGGAATPIPGCEGGCYIWSRGDTAVLTPPVPKEVEALPRVDLATRTVGAIDLSAVPEVIAGCGVRTCSVRFDDRGNAMIAPHSTFSDGRPWFVYDVAAGRLAHAPGVVGQLAQLSRSEAGVVLAHLSTGFGNDDQFLTAAPGKDFHRRTWFGPGLGSPLLVGEQAVYLRTDPVSDTTSLFRLDLDDGR